MAGRIEDYGVIGDLRTMALVGADGSIDWLCLPQFDSAACFAALLDDDRAGRWLAPAGAGYRTRRRYRGESLVLATDWEGPGGTVRVIDFMPSRGSAGDVADVVRIVQGVSGRVPMRMELGLRFDYGSVTPWLSDSGDQHVALAGPGSARLGTCVPVAAGGGRWMSEFTVSAGDRIPFVLTHGPSHLAVPGQVGAENALREMEASCSFWLAYAQHATGRVDEGCALFERLLGLRNDVGLLTEEYDPRRKGHLGNTPQASSHLALVGTALYIERGAPCAR